MVKLRKHSGSRKRHDTRKLRGGNVDNEKVSFSPQPVRRKPGPPSRSPASVIEARPVSVEGTILPQKPTKPKGGPNNSVRPYIPMVNRTGFLSEPSMLNKNVNSYKILNRLTRFSSPTIQKGKKAYFSRNQVKRELERAKEEAYRKQAESELVTAAKNVEQELVAAESTANKTKTMTLKNRLEKIKKQVSNFGKQKYKQYKNQTKKNAIRNNNIKFLRELNVAASPNFYVNVMRDYTTKFGRSENESLRDIFQSLKNMGIEDPHKYLKNSWKQNVAEIVGIPLERFEEIYKEYRSTVIKGINVYLYDYYFMDILPTEALKTGQKGEAFVLDFLKKKQQAQYEGEKRRKEEEEREASTSSGSSSSAYEKATVARNLGGLFF